MQTSLAIALVALAASLFAVLVSVGTALRLSRLYSSFPEVTRSGLPAGAEVPAGALASHLDGEASDWLEGPSLLVFVTPGCRGCTELLENWDRRGGKTWPERLLMVDVDAEDEALGQEHAFPARWVLDRNRALQQAFQVQVFPHGYLVESGRVEQSGHPDALLATLGRSSEASTAG
jgi:hypothetical protein